METHNGKVERETGVLRLVTGPDSEVGGLTGPKDDRRKAQGRMPSTKRDLESPGSTDRLVLWSTILTGGVEDDENHVVV